MTDNEIVKALKYCKEHKGMCTDDCIYRAVYRGGCLPMLQKDVINLINRQKAEIEKYKSGMIANAEVVKTLTNELKTAKSEAIKEFAERLKERYEKHILCSTNILNNEIDNLVKEMTEVER